jgi:hypothetical protein
MATHNDPDHHDVFPGGRAGVEVSPKKRLNGATLLISIVLPTMPGPREFIGHYFGTKGAQDEAHELVGSHLLWTELPNGSSGFGHYAQRGLSPRRVWVAAVPDKNSSFVVLEF